MSERASNGKPIESVWDFPRPPRLDPVDWRVRVVHAGATIADAPQAIRVLETSQPIAAVARDLGINEGTLGNWVNKYRNDHPASEELNISERSRLKELEKENRELRMERDFLKKAAAFFASKQQNRNASS